MNRLREVEIFLIKNYVLRKIQLRFFFEKLDFLRRLSLILLNHNLFFLSTKFSLLVQLRKSVKYIRKKFFFQCFSHVHTHTCIMKRLKNKNQTILNKKKTQQPGIHEIIIGRLPRITMNVFLAKLYSVLEIKKK